MGIFLLSKTGEYHNWRSYHERNQYLCTCQSADNSYPSVNHTGTTDYIPLRMHKPYHLCVLSHFCTRNSLICTVEEGRKFEATDSAFSALSLPNIRNRSGSSVQWVLQNVLLSSVISHIRLKRKLRYALALLYTPAVEKYKRPLMAK